MKNIRILFTIGRLDPGGKERCLMELMRNIPEDKYEIFLNYSGGDARNLNPLYKMGNNSFKVGSLDIFKFIKVVMRVDPNVIACWSRPTAFIAYLAKLLLRGQFLVINMSLNNAPVRKNIFQYLNAIIYSYYDIVVSNSRAGLCSYNQTEKPNRFILYNGFDRSRVPNISQDGARDKVSLPKNTFIVSMVAGLKKTKDHACLIKAAKECYGKDQDILFYIVGDGPNRKALQKYVEKLGLPNIKFLGNRSDVEYIIKSSDITVLCSTNGEGISNSILESLACGVPVIATEGGGTSEIIIDGDNGYLVKARDYVALSEKIIFLRRNKVVLENLANAGPSSIKKFSMENSIKSFEEILRRTLGTAN